METGFTKTRENRLGSGVASSAALALAVFSGAAAGQTPSFTLITPGPGATGTQVNGLSSDGLTVLGQNVADGFAFSWTQAGGRRDIGLDAGFPGYSSGYGASDNSAVIVGRAGPDSMSYKAFRYSNGVYQQLQTPASYVRSTADGISGNGELIVGSVIPVPGFPVPAKWNASGVLQELGFPNPGDAYGYLRGVSRDGTLAYGQCGGGTGNTFEAVTWSPAAGWRTLPPVPGVPAPYNAQALGCSANGRFIVGNVLPSIGLSTASLWDNGLALALPPLVTGRQAQASGVSDDGRLIVGTTTIANNVFVPTIWINGQQPTSLADFFNANGVPIPSGWTLRFGQGISGNGQTVVGTATGPDGFTNLTFVATIPQPGPLVLAGVMGSALAFRRRRGVR